MDKIIPLKNKTELKISVLIIPIKIVTKNKPQIAKSVALLKNVVL